MTPFGLAFVDLEYYSGDQIFYFNNTWNSIEAVIDICFMIEIVVCFNSSYFEMDSNEYVYDRRKIAKSYLKGWFWIDFLAVLPRFINGVYNEKCN